MPIRMSGMISGLDTDAIVKELMSAQSLKKTKIEQNKQKLDWKKEKWEALNTKIYSLYTEKLSSLKLEGSYLTKKVSSTNEAKATATASNAVNGSYTLEIKSMATSQYVTGADVSAKEIKNSTNLSEIGMTIGQTITLKTGKDLTDSVAFTIDEDSTVSDLVKKLSSGGINIKFDETNGRFFINAQNTGKDNRFTLESSVEDGTGAGLDALGLGTINEALASSGQTASDASTMAVVAASDASIVLNGAVMTSSVNTFIANGLTVEVNGTTAPGEIISLTVANDTESVYNKVKEFVKSYNELLTEMYDTYNAPSAKDYAMLTEEDKEAMSDEQVELWENKIKDSLLRRDDTLNSIMTSFRDSLAKTVEIDGTNYSLSSYGIVTGVYTEHGILHINGDSEDGTYADKTDLLKEALDKDPETVSKVLSKLMSGLYSELTDKMSASSISSALTFYNDKQIQSQMDEYGKQIKTWENRLKDIEDRYYDQFGVMESAMAKLQSTQNQMAGLMGLS